MSIFIITGISGSGKSVALHALEDAGYDCVDNIPVNLLENLIDSLHQSGSEKLAIAIDARRGESIQELPAILEKLQKNYSVKVLFLNATTDTLVKRFSETRRRHPLSSKNLENSNNSLIESINLERELLQALNEKAHSIDTSHIRAHALRTWVLDLVQHDHAGLTLLIESFGYKHGLPQDADLAFDVRCILNPHYDPLLRPLTGNDQAVIDFLDQQPDFHEMSEDICAFIEKWLPKYMHDKRSYLTIAIGCTGGQHRSVAMVNLITKKLKASQNNLYKGIEFLSRHRELDNLNVKKANQ
jgi:UPF0042 nucleotide-binding protein